MKEPAMVVPTVETHTVSVTKTRLVCPEGYRFYSLQLPWDANEYTYDRQPRTIRICVTEEFVEAAKKVLGRV